MRAILFFFLVGSRAFATFGSTRAREVASQSAAHLLPRAKPENTKRRTPNTDERPTEDARESAD